jgi:hypothetical protein
MQGGLGPRFVLEAAFLIALAVAAGIAGLSATAIVVVMAVAWLLVCLFEVAVWAEGPRFPSFRREVLVEEEQLTAIEPPAELEPEPQPEPPRRNRFWRRRHDEPGPEPIAAVEPQADGEGT